MKFCDILKLILYEYKYEKRESIMSVVLQWIVYTGVLFVFTISFGLDEICSEYISPMYPSGYDFYFEGYGEADLDDLEGMGVYNITFSNVGDGGHGYIENLNGIWKYKLKATMKGKDIWNSDIDEVLIIVFLGQLIFASIGVMILCVMFNCVSNAFKMKLIRRKVYIDMLKNLGGPTKICQYVYGGLFCARNFFALISAVCSNAILIFALNQYINIEMSIFSSFRAIDWKLFLGICLISYLVIILFQRQLREK